MRVTIFDRKNTLLCLMYHGTSAPPKTKHGQHRAHTKTRAVGSLFSQHAVDVRGRVAAADGKMMMMMMVVRMFDVFLPWGRRKHIYIVPVAPHSGFRCFRSSPFPESGCKQRTEKCQRILARIFARILPRTSADFSRVVFCSFLRRNPTKKIAAKNRAEICRTTFAEKHGCADGKSRGNPFENSLLFCSKNSQLSCGDPSSLHIAQVF